MSDFDFGDLDDMEAHNKREVMVHAKERLVEWASNASAAGGGGGRVVTAIVLKPARRKGRIPNWEEEGDREGVKISDITVEGCE
ncbi:hypothetical protein [Oryza sativa Japonica Group]|uniref:Uncharacterized protein n=3 Tax=Oryza sativa subsp. japonica TaxID=39947 RepID=Q5NA02_ORYSJ|nr:hypothetical protein [Oryza sativa Japonica Group]BAD81755.1 hypothetical protein [Oryza sativa Japonica Group]